MDNNHSNSSEFDSYDTGSLDTPLIDNYMEPDPSLVCIFNDEPNVLPQQRNARQNDPFGVEEGNFSFTGLTIQDVSTHGDNDLTIGGVVSNLEKESWSTRKRKIPIMDPMIEDQPMHGNNNFPNGVKMSAHINLNELRFWPPGPKPMFCTCCQVLRQLIYTNGSDCERFEIHGEIGVISHAIVHRQNLTPDGLSCDAYRKIDFCHCSISEIKSYQVEYCAQKNKLGYIALEDPLSAYYEALCTDLETVGVFSDEDDNIIPPNDEEKEPEFETENKRASTLKPNRGDQIKRIKMMTLNDLSGVFHLTIKVAAAQLGISVSGIKTICRRESISYWPQRKVQWCKIQGFQELITGSCGGVTPTGIELLQLEE